MKRASLGLFVISLISLNAFAADPLIRRASVPHLRANQQHSPYATRPTSEAPTENEVATTSEFNPSRSQAPNTCANNFYGSNFGTGKNSIAP